MHKLNFYHPRDPNPDPAGGGGTEVIDRGDLVTEENEEEEVRLAAEALAATDAEAKRIADELQAKQDEKDAKEGKAKSKDSRIPLARHEEILKKERERTQALETQLATLRKGQQTQVVNTEIAKLEKDVTALDKKYGELVADAKLTEAAEVMRDLRAAERAINTARISEASQNAYNSAIETARYDTAVERIESAWPALNEDHEDFDAARSIEVAELIEGFVRTGKHTRVQALQKAVRYVMGEPKTAKQETVLEVTPAATEAEKVAAERKAAAVKKALETAIKQPADASKTGKDSDAAGGGPITAKQVISMSQDEFKKLSEKTLAALRGDSL